MTRIVDAFPHPVREVENLWIPLPDGTRLAARLWLPEVARPVSVVLEYLPYRKRDMTRRRDDQMHRWFAGHGIACARVDIRGTGDSDGRFDDEYSRQEQEDALQVIAWLAAQPWCSGAVGMIGISWGGFNALQVAALRPPALKAVITLCASDDRYADDAHYMGGCLLMENLQWGSILMHYTALPPDPELAEPKPGGGGWRAEWQARLAAVNPFPAIWMGHPSRDAYWRHGSVCEDYAAIACPVLAVGGWADGYSNAVPRLMAGLQVPCRGIVGPWSHAFPHDPLPGPAIGFLQEALHWWQAWLDGAANGVMAGPRYRVWMQDSVLPQPQYEERPGRWVAEESWPSARIRPLLLHLTGNGLLPDPAPGVEMAVQSPQVTGFFGGEWCAFGADGEMPVDQRPDDGRSLCFDSAPLETALEILGAPEVRLRVSVDRPAAFLAVRLCDLFPDGTSARVTFGLLNLCQRDGNDSAVPLEPGESYDVTVRLNDIAHNFPAGHGIRLAISTAYWPMVWPSPAAVTARIDTAASSLSLPVRPPDPADADLPDYPPAEMAASRAHVRLHPASFRRTIERDLVTGDTVYTLLDEAAELGDGALMRIEAIGLDVGSSYLKRCRIADEDPTHAAAEIVQRTRLSRGDWHVRLETRTRLTADRDQFRFHAEQEAFEDGHSVSLRSWDIPIRRDGL
ncbi:MAG: CocE/NonD family hydrolase [Sneathiellaceae bacterium]